MKDNRERITEIVEDCGGVAAMAAALDVSKRVVCNWRNRGDIPRRYWSDIIKLTGGAVGLAKLAGVEE